MRGYFHPAANRPLLWNIVNTAELVDWLPQLADPALRERYRRLGLRRAAAYSWQAFAEETLKVLVGLL